MVRRKGRDLTIAGVGVGVHRVLEAADILAAEGISTSVIDLRSIAPLDREAVAGKSNRTGRNASGCRAVRSIHTDLLENSADHNVNPPDGLLRKKAFQRQRGRFQYRFGILYIRVEHHKIRVAAVCPLGDPFHGGDVKCIGFEVNRMQKVVADRLSTDSGHRTGQRGALVEPDADADNYEIPR